MFSHQFITHAHNLFSMGGRVDGQEIDKCWVFYLSTAEVERIINMDQPRDGHILHYDSATIKAYVVSGYNGEYIKVCLKFDIVNQQFLVIGELNTAREFAGVVTT